MSTFSVGKDDRPRLWAHFGVHATKVAVAAAKDDTTIYLFDDANQLAGMTTDDVLVIRAGHERMERKVISSVNATTGAVVLTTALRYAHAVDEPAWKAAAPTTITLTYQSPSQAAAGTTTTKAIGDLTNPYLGYYYYELDVSEEGTWRVRWKATGAVVAATDADDLIEVIATGLA